MAKFGTIFPHLDERQRRLLMGAEAVLAFAATGEGPFGTGTTAALLYRVVYGSPTLWPPF